MTAPDLKPCPWCGKKARIWQDPSHSAAFFVGCDDGETDCFGSIHWGQTKSETITAWNTRAAPEIPQSWDDLMGTKHVQFPRTTPLAEALAVPLNCRKWPFYPIEMPTTADGKGPATIGIDAASVEYEVWDQDFNTHASFNNLADAINEAMRLSIAALRAIGEGRAEKPGT